MTHWVYKVVFNVRLTRDVCRVKLILMTEQTMHNYITADPKICFGKPVFKGTRIAVYLVLELLEAGVTVKEIISADYYPNLTMKHVQAALHYAVRTAQNQHSFV